ncbi:hypothetical protein CANINC_000589 [Pichia inconspicua]|uniref:Arginyl-tRNA--protein transferase 1 n=1 Tax=Pichia inconspicua TaxID=52247 RepID=A0A4T0X7M8_9ASCO|nr:hypothetical protein CANINC_000589 [[Candida] inconspicua]
MLHYVKSTHCGYCDQKKEPIDAWSLPSVYELMQGKGYPNNCSLSDPSGECTLQMYEQRMMDGWRRSGDYMYKPDLLRSCCRQYPIRTNYSMFVNDGFHNKSTKKSIRRFYREMTGSEITTTNLEEMYNFYDKGSDRFFTVLMPDSFGLDKFDLFRKYQISAHNETEEEVTPESFYRFLCSNPFEQLDINWIEVNREWGKGNYNSKALQSLVGPVHECYIIDGELAAIAVLDILPTSVSSVYFMWDPKHAKLGLGTVSAIREIMLAKLLHKDHYYLGFYIPDCAKMVYKAKFGGEIRNFDTSGDIEWVKLKDVDHKMKDGKLHVFDSNNLDIAEQLYGVATHCLDESYIHSFDPVESTQLSPMPELVP